MKKKFKSLILVLVLVVCAFSLVGLSGCGEVSIKALGQKFEELDQTYADCSTTSSMIFSENTITKVSPTFKTKYYVSYGTSVDSATKTALADSFYGELESRYNFILAVANDFIDGDARKLILQIPEKSLNSATKEALKQINGNISTLINYFPTFISERYDMVEHFKDYPSTSTDDAKSIVRIFKQTYGEFVIRSVNIANSMANALESSGILDNFAKTGTLADTLIYRDYLRVKLLPIYTQLTFSEVHDKMFWDDKTIKGDAKVEIDKLLKLVGDERGMFLSDLKSTLIDDDSKYVETDKLADIIKVANNFFVEQKSYIKAVKGIKIKTWASSKYNGDMKAYIKDNKLVEVYLQKCNQFLSCTVKEFLKYIKGELHI